MRRLLALALALSLAAAGAAQTPDPAFSKAFSPDEIGPGSASLLTLTIDNSASATPLTGLAFTDALPGPVQLADPAALSTSCVGGSRDGTVPVLTGGPGDTTFSLSGGSVPGGATCTVTVYVTTDVPGTHTNTTSPLSWVRDGSPGTSPAATDVLTVSTDLPGVSKAFSPSTVAIGGRTTLTVTIDNSANGSVVPNLDFTDAFPSGLEVADPANASTTCGTATIPATLTATPGSSTVTLDADGTFAFPAVAAEATCEVVVDLTAVGGGTQTNVVEVLAQFESAGLALAELEVVASTLALQKSFLDDPVAPGGQTRLRFRLRNLAREGAATDVAFSDDLDATLSGLTATGLPQTNVCGAGSTVSTSDGGASIDLTGGTLAPGEQCSFTVLLDVPAGASTGVYENVTSGVTGTIDGSPAAGVEARDDLFVAAVPTFSKEFTDDPVVPGGTVTLEFTIGNSSPTSTATDIAFDDELTTFLPFPLSVDLPPSPDPPCGAGSSLAIVSAGTNRQALRLAGGELAGGESCTFSVGINIPDDLPGGTYTNTTEPITATIDGGAVTGGRASDELTVISAPDFAKSFRNSPVAPGGTALVRFRLALADEAAGPATAVTFSDDLSAVLPGLVATNLPLTACGGTAATTDGGATFTFAGGTLAPGEVCTFDVHASVPAGTAPGTYTNTTSDLEATVEGFAVTTPAAEAELVVVAVSFTKEFVDDPIPPTGTATLRFTVVNDGSVDISAFTFQDDLTAMLAGAVATDTPVSACGGTLTGTSTLSFFGGPVAAGTSCSIDVTVDIPDGTPSGRYRNRTNRPTFTVGGETFSLRRATDFLLVDAGGLPPAFSKAFAPDDIPAGGTSVLTFTIDNGDNVVAATGLDFTDVFPSGLTLASPASASTTCSGGTLTAPDGGTTVSYTGGSVAAGEACTVTVSVTAAALGSYDNVSGDLTSSRGNSGPAEATLTVSDDPIAVTKTDALSGDADGDDRADIGDTIAYTVVITNNDPREAPAITFDDTPDAQTSIVTGSVATDTGTVTSGNGPGDTAVAVDVGVLPSGASATITFEVLADAVDSALVCNQGTATNSEGATPTDDPDTPVSNDATCTDADPNQPPVADAGPDQTAECVGPDGAVVQLDGSGSSDPNGDALTYTWTGPFSEGGGTVTGVSPLVTLPVGVHTITLTVEDPSGATSTDTVEITVEDTTAPVVTVGAAPLELWPPNHEYVTVYLADLGVTVADACDTSASAADVVIAQATSDEPENGAGDGNTLDDIVIAPTCDSVDVRRERQGSGNGRVYELTLAVADGAGNVGTATYDVAVPKSRNRAAVKDAPQYTVAGCAPPPPFADGSDTSDGPVTAAPIFGASTAAVPDELALGAVFPNPLGRSATVAYDVPEAGTVRVAVYDALGREVAVLVDGAVAAGAHRATLDAAALPSGTYLVRMTTPGGFDASRPITVLR
ncbi:PKD domain-containing protein [Rubrivirga sp. IMCC45206]|uniref:DUF7933 domain-containing protein n=1 Tax=Rubrivirga sp. IMCC45206 TaxID=3391614 RepID=UPI0039901FD2